MSGRRLPVLSRRRVATLLLQGALWGGRALAQVPETGPDRGIGGTGVAATDPNETLGQDRGIGGTGVIGTIRGFGSIVVNDLRVTFTPGVSVTIDGRAATPRELKLGHVVRVLARHRGAVLITRAIVVRSEVVGPVDKVEEGRLVVLGQRVVVPEGVTVPEHRAGDHVAVSGLRRLDGSVVASLVEVRPPGPARLHGLLEAGDDGGLSLGGLSVADVSPSLAGRFVSLIGMRRGTAFHASVVTVEPRVPFAAADRISIEAYVARGPDGLRLGSGEDVSADASALAEVGDEAPVRAVVTASPDPSGRLDALSLRVERQARAGHRGSGAPGGPGSPSGEHPGRGAAGGPNGAAGNGGPGTGGAGGGGPGGSGAGGGGGPGGAGR